MQQLWQEKLHWDEFLPAHLQTTWERYQQQLKILAELQIPRGVIDITHPVRIEIHGFSDASERAYGAAIYIRSINAEGKIGCHLLCAKTQVALLKQISLPRLELCGALLLAQLYKKVIESINREHTAWFWTDSMIVLAWVKGSPSQWQTFVANRVAQIQDAVGRNKWSYVNTKENPADLLTRGLATNALKDNTLWWAGPKWLSLPLTEWPTNPSEEVEAPERKKIKPVTLITTTIVSSALCERFATFYHMQRVSAYCRRFAHNCRTVYTERRKGALSVLELQDAERIHVRMVQEESFKAEITQLRKGLNVHSSSRLLALNPFLDEIGLLRVGGRLANTTMKQARKYPIILPASHHITKLITQHAHVQNLHAGIQATLAAVRERYWLLSGRSTIRKYLRTCVTCFKNKPKINSPLMGQPPASRATPAVAFHSVGIDYAGPIYIKSGNKRSRTFIKGYIAVFICFASKAIHLEAVSALTTEAFLAAFRRFVSRRGLPAHVHSDHGTNFVGAKRKLKELTSLLHSKLFEGEVIDDIVTKGTQWHFIPSHSPHFGGLWEAGVKSVKHHLRRITGNAKLTFEELSTLLTQIEAVLNSRPLHPLTEDPDDLSPLTPAHLLIGRPLTAVPDTSYDDVPISRLTRWQHVQFLSQQFWRRWSRDYLPQLQVRSKWKCTSSKQVQIGDLILLKEDHLPPATWRLGRITQLHPGADGITRVVTVKTVSGEVKRCVTKVCALPVDLDH